MKFLKVKEAAELLRLSPFTLRNLIREGKVPIIRLGPRTIRIPESWLEELARSSTSPEIAVKGEGSKMETKPRS